MFKKQKSKETVMKVGELVIYWDGFTGTIKSRNGLLLQVLAFDGSGCQRLLSGDCKILTMKELAKNNLKQKPIEAG